MRFLILALSLSLMEGRRMADGKEWTTENLHVAVTPSYCYDDAETNCQRYGRLYTWESAKRACQTLGAGWRLPTSDEWKRLARPFGGYFDESTDRGKGAYDALSTGGASGLNAVLGGGRSDGKYGRIDAHGFYWTATEQDAGNAVFVNFGKGSHALYLQPDGEKQSAFAVRCVRN